MSEQNQQPKPQWEQTYVTPEMQKMIDASVDKRLRYARPMRFHRFHMNFGMVALPVWYAFSCIAYSWIADGFSLGVATVLNVLMFGFLIVYCSKACGKVNKLLVGAYKSAIAATWFTYGAWLIGMIIVMLVMQGRNNELQQLIAQTLPMGFTQIIIPICVTVYYNRRKELFATALPMQWGTPYVAPKLTTPVCPPVAVEKQEKPDEPQPTKYDALSDEDKKIADALIEQLANRNKQA